MALALALESYVNPTKIALALCMHIYIILLITRRFFLRRPQGSPPETSGLKVLVPPAAPTSPIVHLREQKQKNCVFMYIHNSCSCNSDNRNLSIKTSNAHK